MTPDARDADVEALARVLYDRHGFHAADTWETDTSIVRGHYQEDARGILASDWLADHDAKVRREAAAEALGEFAETCARSIAAMASVSQYGLGRRAGMYDAMGRVEMLAREQIEEAGS